MAPQKRKDKPMLLLKSLVLVITCLSFFGVLSCNNSGTGSITSSAAGSGTGTGWTITIQIGTNPLPFNGYIDNTDPTKPVFSKGTNTTTVMALVKDRTGAPAPKDTNICMTAVLNGFLKAGDTATLYATMCETTSNNLGQSIQTYQGRLTAGDDTIEIASQGVITTATIHNVVVPLY